MTNPILKLFLRLAIAVSFLSAVADRFGLWGQERSVWGNWNSFLDYTRLINPWFPDALIETVGSLATGLEVVFAACLLVGYRTETVAKLSGFLLLTFGLSMSLSTGIKGALDYSVFTASAAAFSLGTMNNKYFEIDTILARK